MTGIAAILSLLITTIMLVLGIYTVCQRHGLINSNLSKSFTECVDNTPRLLIILVIASLVFSAIRINVIAEKHELQTLKSFETDEAFGYLKLDMDCHISKNGGVGSDWSSWVEDDDEKIDTATAVPIKAVYKYGDPIKSFLSFDVIVREYDDALSDYGKEEITIIFNPNSLSVNGSITTDVKITETRGSTAGATALARCDIDYRMFPSKTAVENNRLNISNRAIIATVFVERENDGHSPTETAILAGFVVGAALCLVSLACFAISYVRQRGFGGLCILFSIMPLLTILVFNYFL